MVDFEAVGAKPVSWCIMPHASALVTAMLDGDALLVPRFEHNGPSHHLKSPSLSTIFLQFPQGIRELARRLEAEVAAARRLQDDHRPLAKLSFEFPLRAGASPSAPRRRPYSGY